MKFHFEDEQENINILDDDELDTIEDDIEQVNEVKYINPDNLDKYSKDEIEAVKDAQGNTRYKRKSGSSSQSTSNSSNTNDNKDNNADTSTRPKPLKISDKFYKKSFDGKYNAIRKYFEKYGNTADSCASLMYAVADNIVDSKNPKYLANLKDDITTTIHGYTANARNYDELEEKLNSLTKIISKDIDIETELEKEKSDKSSPVHTLARAFKTAYNKKYNNNANSGKIGALSLAYNSKDKIKYLNREIKDLYKRMHSNYGYGDTVQAYEKYLDDRNSLYKEIANNLKNSSEEEINSFLDEYKKDSGLNNRDFEEFSSYIKTYANKGD